MRNTFNAVYYVGDTDVTVQFAFSYANGWRAVATAANNRDWEQCCMQLFNSTLLNKFTHVTTDMGTEEDVAQDLLQFVNSTESGLGMDFAHIVR